MTPLCEAADALRFGGKAANLARAIAAGLPVPDGVALAVDELGTPPLAEIAARVSAPWAVRSSAVGEDGARTSFAGQHATVLGVVGESALRAAIDVVARSARSASAAAYRAQQNVTEPPRLGIVVQSMVRASVAGVLFSRHPQTGASELFIEASWGLGEAVASGRVVPDQFRVAHDGRVLEVVTGEKAVAFELDGAGVVVERAVDDARRGARCLDDRALGALARLAENCMRVFGDALDLEFAFADEQLALLQWRPITARAT